MLLVIVGAGASYDSVPSRIIGRSDFETWRLPLADELFQPRALFEDVQRLVPKVMQIVPSLDMRSPGVSVEDVLERYAGQTASQPARRTQLACVRFYLQGVIHKCEQGWYREKQVSTNLMALIDQIESARGANTHALFVTFNYDRLIENALENRGSSFRALQDYIRPNDTNVIKLHGSVDWARLIRPFNTSEFGGSLWQVAVQVCDAIGTLPEPGAIFRSTAVHSSHEKNQLTVPAIAIPTKVKGGFECPAEHVEHLKSLLGKVRTVLTVGWRGAERHFLELLGEHARQALDVICVGKGVGAAQETQKNLNSVFDRANIEPYNSGFTQFVSEGKIERLLNITWNR